MAGVGVGSGDVVVPDAIPAWKFTTSSICINTNSEARIERAMSVVEVVFFIFHQYRGVLGCF